MALVDDFEKYLKTHRRDAWPFVSTLLKDHPLVVFGETHVGLDRKSALFARMIDERRSRFHASEYFINSTEVGDKVEAYLLKKMGKLGLPSLVRPWSGVLDAIAKDVNTLGIVYGGSSTSNASRHRPIYNNYKSSLGLHHKAGRFNSSDHGHFIMGAAHAARRPLQGSEKTTAQLLLGDTPDLAVVRLVVDKKGGVKSEGEALTIIAGEGLWLRPLTGGDEIDLVPTLRKVAGGNSFAAVLGSTGSPFQKVKPDGASGSAGYPMYYESLVFLP
jgi:hypothetical protein